MHHRNKKKETQRKSTRHNVTEDRVVPQKSHIGGSVHNDTVTDSNGDFILVTVKYIII